MRSSSAGSTAWRRCSAAFIPRQWHTARACRRPRRSLLHSPPRRFKAHSLGGIEGWCRTRKWGQALMIPLFFLAMAAEAPAAAGSDAPTAKMEKLLQDCDAHKFETVVNTVVDGIPHQSKVKLCGTKGQTDAAWTVTLKDAVA